MSKLNLFVNWPSWPLFDLKLIKGHQFCINKHKVNSCLHHKSLQNKCGLKFVPSLRAIG
jgi:hypothetical protein